MKRKPTSYSDTPIIWRIDDRLIHGQVIVGWCGQLPIKRLVVCDDEIARNEWEKNLLQMAAPSDIPAEILTVQACAEKVPTWLQEKPITLILMKSPDVLEKLLDLNVVIDMVNVGGIHFKEDRKEYLPYLFLSDREVEQFRQLMKRGVHFVAQDLPNSTPHDLNKLLGE